MSDDNSVEFASEQRIHIGLAVTNLEGSLEFYRTLLGTGPSKTRPGYARIESNEPALNLSLSQSSRAAGPADPIHHYGIQVKSTDAVYAARRRLKAAGFDTELEESTVCCHATQSKIWATDPDGNRWEVFMVLDDSPAGIDNKTGCCNTATAPDCCTETPDESCCT